MRFSVELIAVGRLKPTSPFHEAFHEYVRRLNSSVNITEIEARNQGEEIEKLISKINPAHPLIVLDEKGKTLPSIRFAQKIEELQNAKPGPFQCVIGGADGLNDDIRQKADILLSFGQQTWPHMMVRIMLMEQLYRAQQILANHPYHRE
jgi:23S rRNA (pseudouridine1915-N3)-methyltransferase